MIRVVTRKFYRQYYQIDIYTRKPLTCGAVKHFCSQNDKLHRRQEQGLQHIDVLRSSSEKTNKPPVKAASEDDDQTFIQHVVKFVEKTTYMDDVRRAQARVMDIKVWDFLCFMFTRK